MTERWLHRRPGPGENRKAAGLGLVAGVVLGSVVFYVARHVLAREWIPSPAERRDAEGGGRDASG